MEIDIQITERQRNALNDWCIANGINMAEYLGKKVWEAFLVDKYGDLNDKVPKVADKKEGKTPEGVVMAPYVLQMDNIVTITTPTETSTEQSERHEMQEKVENADTKPKTPKKITLTPVK